VIDSERATDSIFRPFEGLWLLSKPSGAIACAKIINGKLLVPYSYSGEEKLSGHYYDCRVCGATLFCRFEQFDSAVAGVLLLTVGPQQTLKGGRWMDNQIPDAIRMNICALSESLAGMQPTVWIRVMNKQTPHWAERYFHEDWPNKHSN
jgi:hypothetical protein